MTRPSLFDLITADSIEVISSPLAADMELIKAAIPLLDQHLQGLMPKYDLTSAHLHQMPIKGLIPDAELTRAQEVAAVLRDDPDSYTRYDLPRMSDLAREIFSAETGMDPSHLEFICSTQGGRTAISKAIDERAWVGKIALPLPNWHFWGMLNGRYERKFAHFHAHDEQELVDKFRLMAQDPSVRGLLLAFPAVPLMYTPSPDAMREIDRVALAHDVAVIVDDVQRGMQPQSERRSVAQYLTRPIIVEGFSKRFGDKPFERLAYVAAPKELGLGDALRSKQYDAEDHVCGLVTELAMRYCATVAIGELAARNRAFDEGFGQPDGVQVLRPSPTHLTTLIKLPDPLKADTFAARCIEKESLYIAPMQAFYPQGYRVPAELAGYFRITTGKLSADKLREAGAIMRKQIMQG